MTTNNSTGKSTKTASREPKLLLVTGITGHTGRYFIEELRKNHYNGKLRCIIHNKKSEEILKKSGLKYEVMVGDLSNQQLLDEACQGVDAILQIYNIRYSIGMIKAATKNDIHRVILVHTTGIFSKYKMASSEYKDIERRVIPMCERASINYTILRPTMIYGDMCDHNISKFIKMVAKLRIFPLIAGGRAKIQPVNARDLGKAYYQVLMSPDATADKQYNLSGSREISIKKMLRDISSYLGKKTLFIPVPLSLSLVAAYILKFITFGKKDIVEKVLRMDESRTFSHADATVDFNYRPMNFDKGLRNEVQQYLGSRNA